MSHLPMAEADGSDVLVFELEDCRQVLGRGEGKEKLFSESNDVIAFAFPLSAAMHHTSTSAEEGFEAGKCLRQSVHEAWSALKREGRDNLADLAFMLASKGNHATRIRSGLGPEPQDSHPARQLRHSFILLEGERQGPVIIVDPYFRDQFKLGISDHEYSSFLNSHVPEVFVGTPKALGSMLRKICHTMHAAMDRLQLSIPPWRQLDAILSMWVPVSFRDEHISPCVSSQSDGHPGQLPSRITYGDGNCPLLQHVKQQQVRLRGGRSALTVKHHYTKPLQQQVQPRIVMGFDLPETKTVEPPQEVSSPFSGASSPAFIQGKLVPMSASVCSSSPASTILSSASSIITSSFSIDVLPADSEDGRQAAGGAKDHIQDKHEAADLTIILSSHDDTKAGADSGPGSKALPSPTQHQTCATEMAKQSAAFWKPLDQLLPHIWTVKLGRA